MSEIQQVGPRAKHRVMIAVPSGDHVCTGFAHDLAQMVGQTVFNNPEIELRLVFNKGTLLQSQRTGLVYDALTNDCTHILWLDSDMRFPTHTIRDLIAWGQPIVGCNYATRRFPIKPTAMLDRETKLRLYTEPDSTGLVEVLGLGFGCVLMDLDVFRYVPQPWFNVEWHEDHFKGEDLYFCDKVRNSGIPVLVDQGLSQHIRHEGSWDYSHDHALAQRAEIQVKEAAPSADLELHDSPK